MDNQMKNNRGFSLIELLIAMTILSIIMVMVTQFMSTSSGALSRTKRNTRLQTEAIEIGEQLTDSLAQATYIRVGTEDGKTYILDYPIVDGRKTRSVTDSGNSIAGDLVVDNYPNYLKNGVSDRKIILDDTNYTLIDENGTVYPLSGDEDSSAVTSFRALTGNTAASDMLYVKPQYIYMQYQKKVEGVEAEAYVIYYMKPCSSDAERKEIYMLRGEMSDLYTGAYVLGDGYQKAVSLVKAKAAGTPGNNGLLTDSLDNRDDNAMFYFSADTKENTVFLDMVFMDSRYKQYTYNYVETVMLRNSNVLTVEPRNIYKKK